MLSSSPVLSFPEGKEEFILDTDASNIGIGAILSQRQFGKEKVIAYFSKVLSKVERNYCVTRRELLDSLKFFRHYLLGRKFVIHTDYMSLKWLMSFEELKGQLARWLERFQEFEFEIIHRKDQSYRNVDGLSRRLCEAFGCEYCAKIEKKSAEETQKKVARIVLAEENLEGWRETQRKDPSLSFII